MSSELSSEYSMLDVVTVLSRMWIPLLTLPLIAGLGVGYWAYPKAQKEVHLQVASVVSMPSLDALIIDLPELFGRDVAANPGQAPTLVTYNLGATNQGARSVMKLVVQAPSEEEAASSMRAFLERLARTVDARDSGSERRTEIDALKDRAETLTKLWDALKNSGSVPGGDATAALALPIHALASASVANALVEVERALSRQESGASEANLRIEVPPGPAVVAPIAKASSWIRLPIAAVVGTAFIVVILAFALDGVRRRRRAISFNGAHSANA